MKYKLTKVFIEDMVAEANVDFRCSHYIFHSGLEDACVYVSICIVQAWL